MPGQSTQRTAGTVYLLIILFGLTAELALRGPLIHVGDAVATAEAVAANPARLRGAILLDAAMVVADILLAVLLYRLLAPVHATVALTAMVFRLMQAATIAASLLALVAVDLLVLRGTGGTADMVLALMQTHGVGYDLGLIFFAVNTGLTAWLLARSGLVPRALPPLLAVAGLVYLLGSVTRLAAPEINALIQPAYAVPLVAELWLALTLLLARRPAPVAA